MGEGRADEKPDRKGRELRSTKSQRNAHRGIAASATTWRRHLGNAPIVQPAIEKKRAKHSPCPGELPPSAPNSLNGGFPADGPFEKMATGIAGFAPGDGKACLSPAIGRFDGAAIAWAMGASRAQAWPAACSAKRPAPSPKGYAAQSVWAADAIADGPAGSGQWINSDSLDRCRKKAARPAIRRAKASLGQPKTRCFITRASRERPRGNSFPIRKITSSGLGKGGLRNRSVTKA